MEKIAVLLYLYDTNLRDEFLHLLINIKNYIHLYLGLCYETAGDTENIFRNQFNKDCLTVSYHSNRGGDTLPFLYQLKTAQSSYDKYIKIHSKKSTLGFKNHVNWRSVLLDSLLRPAHLISIINQLNNKYEMIGPKSLILKNHELTNFNKICQLCNVIKLDYSSFKYKKFVAGNMFAGKIKTLQPFIDHYEALASYLYEETGKVEDLYEGKYVHSLERLFGYVGSLNTNIGYPVDHYLNIVSPKASKHKLTLIELYNNFCYISENINIYGQILDKNEKYIEILWLNSPRKQIAKYIYIGPSTLVNSSFI